MSSWEIKPKQWRNKRKKIRGLGMGGRARKNGGGSSQGLSGLSVVEGGRDK